jgi:hypothetical protein
MRTIAMPTGQRVDIQTLYPDDQWLLVDSASPFIRVVWSDTVAGRPAPTAPHPTAQ